MHVISRYIRPHITQIHGNVGSTRKITLTRPSDYHSTSTKIHVFGMLVAGIVTRNGAW